jgi:ATP-binding cassette subfamily F protein uup
MVGGQPRHVHGYLADFLFPPERAHSPVKALSGGERNRLLLARLLARPANVLILDEPTNDLDLETLELLEAKLVDFPGTILLVSHDRAFLDNVVTSVFAFEGEGRVVEYVGGYEDWERQRRATGDGPKPAVRSVDLTVASSKKASERPSQPPTRPKRAPAAKLSFKDKKELEALPARIEALETEIRAIDASLASPDFYRGPADAVRAAADRLGKAKAELEVVFARWGELDGRADR